MTTTIDTKTCPECCKSFHRGPNHSRREFAARKFCSTPCAAAGKGHSNPIPLPSQEWMGWAACQATGCPVARECLAFGRATRAHGVWGGQFLREGVVR